MMPAGIRAEVPQGDSNLHWTCPRAAVTSAVASAGDPSHWPSHRPSHGHCTVIATVWRSPKGTGETFQEAKFLVRSTVLYCTSSEYLQQMHAPLGTDLETKHQTQAPYLYKCPGSKATPLHAPACASATPITATTTGEQQQQYCTVDFHPVPFSPASQAFSCMQSNKHNAHCTYPSQIHLCLCITFNTS